jgi:hypothetical protein
MIKALAERAVSPIEARAALRTPGTGNAMAESERARSLNELHEGSRSSGGIFDLARLRDEQGRLEEQMADGSFWNHQDNARTVVQRVKELKGWIEPYDKLSGRITSARELEELLQAEPDASVEADLDAEFRSLAGDLREYELRSLLRGRDPPSARRPGDPVQTPQSGQRPGR